MASTCAIEDVVAALRRGGVVAYPTEAVWGLGCDPRDEAATLRLLAIKQREVDKGLILIAAEEAQLAPFVDMDGAGRGATVGACAPAGPARIPGSCRRPPTRRAWITGAHAGIAVRVSAHPLVVDLCKAFGGALVSTSANRAGEPAAHTIDALDPRIVDAVDAVAGGETGGLLRPTDIRDARTRAVLRL